MKGIRELFYRRIYAELINFKNDILSQDKESIYRSAYKIEFFASVYEILVERAEKLSEADLYCLVYQRGSIIEALYEKWLKQEDHAFLELQDYVHQELPKSVELRKAG